MRPSRRLLIKPGITRVGGRWGGVRRPAGLLPILALLAVAALALSRWQPDTSPLGGHASAVDGDTLRLGSVRVRLVGLDAPELDQTCTRADGTEWSCGMEAKAFLAAALRHGDVDCARQGRDVYGRTLATCSVGGADIGAAIVGAGWAIDDGGYASAATAARAQNLGIWSSSFDRPSVWRRDHGTGWPGIWEWIRSWFQ
jgi:endonuclease YncB( thermonuclease family)